jgi:hypothetical protein
VEVAFTEAGTVVNRLFRTERLTTTPPAGTGASILIVTVTVDPPTTLGLENVKLATPGARTVKVPVSTVPLPEVAVMVAVMFALTLTVVIGKLTELLPAAIVTDAGTMADGLLVAGESLSFSLKVIPPGPAGLCREIVPVEFPCPPTTDEGLMAIENGTELIVRVAVTPSVVGELR